MPQKAYAIDCEFGTDIGGECQGFLTTTGSNTWSVPGDWNSSNNTIEVIGGGGFGGGAYSSISNAALSGSVTYSVGIAGTLGTVAGGDTWLCSSTSDCASLAGGSVIVGAQGGAAGSFAAGASGGAAGSGVGTVTFSGGDAGGGAVTLLQSSPTFIFGCLGGGGGGAAGPNGAGGTGTDAEIGVAAGTGGAGDNSSGGAGGGPSTAGSPGTEWDGSHGSGGGGGGGGYTSGDSNCSTGSGTSGGLYGGGAGGGGAGNSSGRQGIIVISYTPATGPETPAGLVTTSVTGGVKLDWTAAGGSPTTYGIYRDTSSPATTLIASISSAGTTYTDSTAQRGVNYFYRVTSSDGSATSSYSNEKFSSTNSGRVIRLGGLLRVN